MMIDMAKRSQLRRFKKSPVTLQGTFSRWGSYEVFGGQARTMCIEDIAEMDGRSLIDHVWVDYSKKRPSLGLERGDRVKFRAIARKYRKGWTLKLQKIERIDEVGHGKEQAES